MTGWRLGYAYGPAAGQPEKLEMLANMLTLGLQRGDADARSALDELPERGASSVVEEAVARSVETILGATMLDGATPPWARPTRTTRIRQHTQRLVR